MKLHERMTGLHGYLMACLVGAILMCGFWYITGLAFAQPKTEITKDKSTENQFKGVLIENNTITDSGTGISVPKNADIDIKGNKLERNKKGVEVRDK
jgi:parallel beta-helix repeat protein